MAVLNFNANEVEPQQELKPLPEGEYKVAVTASESKRNKKDNGTLLQLTFDVLDGEHRGRKLWVYLNLDHPNATAVEIAKSELSAICHAVGVLTPKDSVELHNRPLIASVKLEKRKDNGELSNRVKGYKSLKAAAESTPAPAMAGGEKAPW